MKRINEEYKIERVSEDVEDDYILTNGKKIMIINSTAGEMLLWIKEKGFSNIEDIYDYFLNEYNLNKEAYIEIEKSVDTFISEGVIIDEE